MNEEEDKIKVLYANEDIILIKYEAADTALNKLNVPQIQAAITSYQIHPLNLAAPRVTAFGCNWINSNFYNKLADEWKRNNEKKD